MNRKLLFIIVTLALCPQLMAQGFRVYKDGVVIGTYNAEKFDSISFFLKTEYAAIDLGLPSGTLWADRNVGETEKVVTPGAPDAPKSHPQGDPPPTPPL